MIQKTFLDRIFRGAEYYLTSGYGMRFHPIYQENRMHWGWDFGTHGRSVPLYSPIYGTVVRSSWQSARGWFIEVKDHSGTGYVLLQHLAFRYIVLAKIIKRVKPGSKLGNAGMSGLSKGIHLHLECYDKDHEHISPADFIKGYKDPVFPKYKVVNVGTNGHLNVRNAPGLSGKVLRQLDAGAEVKVYATKDGWCKISYTKEEWVKATYLKKIA